MSLSARSGWFDDENRVYIKYAVKSIMEDLYCSKVTSVGILKELQGIGLIDIEQKNGLANVIYVKNIVSEDKSVPVDHSRKCTGTKNRQGKVDQSEKKTGIEIRPVQKVDESNNQTCTGTKTVPGVVQNLDPSNTDINNNYFRDNNHIIQSKSKEVKEKPIQTQEMDMTATYMELIRKNIEYDIMIWDKKWIDRDIYDELYERICDVVCVPRKTIRIAGEEYPYSLVKSKFLKLNSGHLQYVMDCMKNNTTKVANIKAYVITALYNAPNTISHYYTAEVNHDIYGVN